MKLFSKQDTRGRNKPIIVKKLYNKYNGEIFLNNINFVVYRGEIFSLIGLSGSGKSTLLKTIVGIKSKSSGEVRIFGKNIFFTKKKIGFSPQKDSFFDNLSVIENIKLFSSLYGTKKEKGLKIGRKYLKQLEMDNFENKNPKKLSGGQRKRLNIILSCLHLPKLLILDEPFAGLDYYNRKILWDFITGLKNKGVTIMLTTHLLNEAQDYSSRVFILKNGKKFGYGTFKEVKEKIGFKYLYHIKLSYLSLSFIKILKQYCSLKRIKMIYSLKKEILFGLESDNEKKLINAFLKKKKQKFTEVAFRKPNLDEVILASR